MAKASPQIRSFNAGEISPLMEGRTDTGTYPASNRNLYNTVAAPQGPAIPRSGTEFIAEAYSHTDDNFLIPFVFSEEDFYMLEFANQRVRFLTEFGLLTYAPVAMTVTSVSPFKIDSATLGASVGDEVSFSLFPQTYNLNGVTGKITAKVGTVYTLDIAHPALPMLGTAKAARVYHIVSPYQTQHLNNIVDVPSLEVVYLYHGAVKPYKLKRFDTYNWVFEVVNWVDGPYLSLNEEKTTLAPATTGRATPDMTAANAPAGWVASASSEVATFEAWKAFDDSSAATYWQSNVNQSGQLKIEAPAAFVCDGYSIHMAINNANVDYTSKDYAPSNFTFEGSNNNTDWDVLDRQATYVLYDSNKSVFFQIPNLTAYKYYRLNIESTVRNGALKPTVKSLILRSPASISITINASSVTGINNNQGFLSTDVGRLLRIRGDDGAWRPLIITARNSTTQVVANLLGEPFANLRAVTQWRLGAWSDTTGYPNTGAFFQDRLWSAGGKTYPDLLAASQTGFYERMAPTDEKGTVLDTSGIAVRLNSRRLSRIKWLAGVKKGLALGSGSQEFLVQAGGNNVNNRTITPGNIIIEDSSTRGSADTTPVPVDSQVLFVQRSGRTLREFAYNYEADGYKSPSMSLLASHLGVSPFEQMAYAAEPYSIVWIRRQNGSLVGLTYNREESVVGWHRHSFQDEEVRRIAVAPSSDQLQDHLWMTVRRTVDGQTKRYIEKLTKFWDFGMTLDDACFVDSSLRYDGDPTTEVYGLQHLEGREVYGLADGIAVGPFTVTDGMVTLDYEASKIILGLGFDSEGETVSLENGAQDGTAQGKEKRINLFTLKVWDSYGGELGTYNEDKDEVEWVDLRDLYPGDADLIETIELYTGILGPVTPAPGYEKRGSVFFRRPKETPTPFNLVAIMPQLNTQDRG